jgi:hypothetical protein
MSDQGANQKPAGCAAANGDYLRQMAARGAGFRGSFTARNAKIGFCRVR